MNFETYRLKLISNNSLYERDRSDVLLAALNELIIRPITSKNTWCFANLSSIDNETFHFCICRYSSILRHAIVNGVIAAEELDDVQYVDAILNIKTQVLLVSSSNSRNFATTWMPAFAFSKTAQKTEANRESNYEFSIVRITHDQNFRHDLEQATVISSFTFIAERSNPHPMKNLAGTASEMVQESGATKATVTITGKSLDKAEVLEAVTECEKNGNASLAWIRPQGSKRSKKIQSSKSIMKISAGDISKKNLVRLAGEIRKLLANATTESKK